MQRRLRAASLPLLCLPAFVSTGCYLFYPHHGRVGNALEEKQVSRGDEASGVRSILGDPWRMETEGAEERWIYCERWADGIDFSRQFTMGFLTLGIYWFLPPEPEYHEVIFRDGRAAAIVRFGNSSPYSEPSAGKCTIVTTDPPHARIEVDGVFVGHSPLRLQWKVPAHWGKYFADREHTITARREAAPYTLKEARIPGGKFVFYDSDRIPPSVEFDLKTPPETAPEASR
jgi:hypothetical protein